MDLDRQILIRVPESLLQGLDAIAKSRSAVAGVRVRRAQIARALLEEAVARDLRAVECLERLGLDPEPKPARRKRAKR